MRYRDDGRVPQREERPDETARRRQPGERRPTARSMSVDDDGGLRGWVGLPELFAFGFEAAPEAGTTVETVMNNPPFLLESDNVRSRRPAVFAVERSHAAGRQRCDRADA